MFQAPHRFSFMDGVESTLCLARRVLFFLLIALPGLAQTPAVQLEFTAPAHGTLFAQAEQTVSGTVLPIDASLALNGQAVAVLPDGSWSTTVTLHSGLNTLRFRAEKAGHSPALRTLDLYWDQTPPVLTIQSPADNSYHNTLPIQINGTVTDTFDASLTLTRDGSPVPLLGGSFTDSLETLPSGTTTLTYQASDSTGHTATSTLTLLFNDVPPTVTLTAPSHVLADTPFDITVSAAPLGDIVALELFKNGTLLYEASSGSTHTLSESLPPASQPLELTLRVRDLYGNTATSQTQVLLANPQLVYGTVLNDATGLPMAGTTVAVETPIGIETLTTDSAGVYQATVYGTPITVTTSAPGFVPMQRELLSTTDVWRVTDLRLTSLGTAAPAGVSVTPTGFTGTSQLSFFSAQALPVLLPLGWSPVLGVHLDQVSGTGSLTIAATDHYLPENGTFFLLSLQGSDWVVVAQQPSTALSFTHASATPGTYLVAIPDTWSTASLPANGQLLRRRNHTWVSLTSQDEAETNPPMVSILDTPQTTLTHAVSTHGEAPSGSQARLETTEQHFFFYQPSQTQTYSFDAFYYSYTFGDHQQPTRLGTRLPIHARTSVDVQQTERAELRFRVNANQEASIHTPEDLVWELFQLSLDFTGSFAGMPAVDLTPTYAEELPLPTGAQLIQAFQFTTTIPLQQPPLFTLEASATDGAAVILLERIETGWIYAGRLSLSGESWLGSMDLDLLDSGTFALVSLNREFTELRGTVAQAGAPVVNAAIVGEHFPWSGLSRTSGIYRYLVPQLTVPQTVSASSQNDSLKGQRTLAANTPTLLTNQDIDLALVEFQLLDHFPMDGAVFQPLFPNIQLQFNRPLTGNETLLASSIQLLDSTSNPVTVQMLPEPGRRVWHLVPTQALAPASAYQVLISSSLESLFGEAFQGPTSFSFTTLSPTLTDSLNLQRFYLEWDATTETMTLVGPATSYPSGTRLEVFVQATGYFLTATLTSGEYRHALDALPGDVVTLLATAPDGNTQQRNISRVVNADGSMTLGSQAQVLPLDADTDIAIDQVAQGARDPFTLDPLTIPSLTAIVDATPTFSGATPMLIRGYTLESTDGGPLPQFSGQFIANLDPSSWPNGFLQLVAIIPDIQAPADPTQPTVLSNHSFAYLQDVLAVVDGEIKGEGVTPTTNGSQVAFHLDLADASLPLDHKVHLAILLTPSGASKAGGKTANKLDLNPPVIVSLKADRKNHDSITPPLVTPAPWHNTLKDSHPVPGAFLYELIRVGDYYSFALQGVTGKNGSAQITVFGEISSFRGLDPVTGELALCRMSNQNTVVGVLGIEIVTNFTGKVTFDPVNHLIATGQSPPPSLSLKWEIGTQVDATFIPDPNATLTLQRFNKIQASNDKRLRLTVHSDQNIAKIPAPSLTSTDVLQPEGTEPESRQVVFEVPAGTLTGDKTITYQLSVANEGGQVTTVTREILVISGAHPGPKPGKPTLIAFVPADKAEATLTATPYLLFSEPVKGVTDQTVTLSRDGATIPVEFLDQDGLPVQPDTWITELTLLPQQSLRFNSTFSLNVGSLQDQENLSLTPHLSTFTTPAVQRDTQPHYQTIQDMAGLGNLVLTISHQWADAFFKLDLYDISNPDKPMVKVWDPPLQFHKYVLAYRIALLSHEALRIPASETDASALRAQEQYSRQLKKLPRGTLLAMAYLKYGGLGSELAILEFDGTDFRFKLTLPLPSHGWPESVTSFGRHLFISFAQNGETQNELQRGSTLVYDIPKLLEDYPKLQEELKNPRRERIRIEQDLFRAGMVATYPIPGDVAHLTPFYRKANDTYVPAFLMSGALRPAIYPLDLAQQPRALGIPLEAPGVVGEANETDGITPKYDGRMLAYTDYVNAPGISKKGNGAVEQLTYWDPRTQTQKSSDFALFSNTSEGLGIVSIYELPQSIIPTHQHLQPLITLEFPEGVESLDLDAEWGFFAVTTRDQQLAVYDLRVLLEDLPPALSGTHALGNALTHPSILFPPLAQDATWVQFHKGSLFSADSSGNFHRIPIAPKEFRDIGWEVYDLAEWMDKDGTTLPNHLEEALVLYASDLVLPADATMENHFVMEMATFILDIRDVGDITVEIKALKDNQLLQKITRENLQGPRREPISTYALKDYFNDPGKQRYLRENLYQAFRVSYQVWENHRLVSHGHNDFAVMYLAPETRYLDGYRDLGSVDALTRMPMVHDVDYAFSTGDPRLSLSPSRYYHAGSAFQRGAYGVGMLNGQLLHMALPSWWRLDQMGNGLPPQTAAVQRLVLEQPGHFQTQFLLDAQGQPSAPVDDLTSTLNKRNGIWHFLNDDSVRYEFTHGKSWPTFYKTFTATNGTNQVKTDALRFPLFRLKAGINAPGQLYAEAPVKQRMDLPWGNKLIQNAPKKALHIDQLAEVLKDVEDTHANRLLTLDYEAKNAGTVIGAIFLESRNTRLTYAHDDDGYLESFRIKGERPKTYTWEPIGLTLGDVPVKRLKRIQQGDWFTEFAYLDDTSLQVSQIVTPFGSQILTALNEPTTGLPGRVTLGNGSISIDSPKYEVEFAKFDHQWLSSKEIIGASTSFPLTWKRISPQGDTSRGNWFLSNHGFRAQEFTYDPRGRLTKHTRDGGEQSWAYGNTALGLKHIPTFFKDSENQEFNLAFTFKTEGSTLEIKQGALTQTTEFSASGTPKRVKDPLGQVQGASATSHYTLASDQFQQLDGRPTTQFLSPSHRTKMGSLAYNIFQDITAVEEAGIKTTYSDFDDLGRPGAATTLDNVTTQYTYSYEGGLYQVQAVDTGSGLTTSQFFSRRGNLIRSTTSLPGQASRTTLYDYDPFGRLLTVTEDGQNRYSAEYPSEHILLPSEETFDAETFTYTLANGFNPKINGITYELDEKPSPPIEFATDTLGRVIRSQMDGVGKVDLSYDGFGRVTKIAQPNTAKEGEAPGITITYENNTITIHDRFRNLETVQTLKDNEGLSWSLQESVIDADGNITKGVERDYTTELAVTSGNLGHRFSIQESGNILDKSVTFSATGHALGASYGNRSWNVDETNRNRFGQPTQVSGAFTGSFTYDSLGRPSSVTSPAGTVEGFVFDDKFRLSKVKDIRGKDHFFDYFGTSSDLSTIAIEGQNTVEGASYVPIFSASSRTSASTNTWLGRSRDIETPQLGARTEITRLHDDAPSTAALSVDPETGLPQSLQSFIPTESTNFQWNQFGRDLSLTMPSGEIYQALFDSYGQLQELSKEGVPKLELIRDSENRLETMVTENRQFEFNYQQENLESIVGGDHPIAFFNHNAKGQPQQIDIGGVASMDVDYFDSGAPSSVVFSRVGGEATHLLGNEMGDLLSIQRGHQSPVTFTYNEWGAPATMSFEDDVDLELFSGNLKELNFPAQVKATLDDEARIATLIKPGVGTFRFTYDANDVHDKTYLKNPNTGEEILIKDLETVNQLLQTQTIPDNSFNSTKTGSFAETQNYSYDGRGRVTQMDSSLDGTSAYTYGLEAGTTPQPGQRHSDRVKTYTDPNGVVYHYSYTREGYVSRIDIENGPTFAYTYDTAGNLLSVSVDNMAAKFANYDGGLPSDVSWEYADATEQSFTLTRTPNGRFQEIANGDYQLSLQWSSDPEPGTFPMPVIQAMTKKGPGLKEIWVPSYDAQSRLTGVVITRTTGSDVDADPACGDCQTTVIEETYGSMHQLMTGLTRIVDGITVLDASHTLDTTADERRISDRTVGATPLTTTYDVLGSITAMDFSAAISQTFDLDGTRRPRVINTTDASSSFSESYGYDMQSRRIRRETATETLVFAHHGSRVIAMGTRDADGIITWTHAFGHGPLGPAFQKDLTDSGHDLFIFTDHLGTPFAWHNPVTDATAFTPFNPWGELLATHPDRGPPWESQGQVPTNGFTLPTDAVLPLPPMGLAGHLYDTDTGLVQMHHRYYSPRLGHFLTPDYRTPDIYDPSTFTEPYAYAAGNPMLYWDPDGLEVRVTGDQKKVIEDFFGKENVNFVLHKRILAESLYELQISESGWFTFFDKVLSGEIDVNLAFNFLLAYNTPFWRYINFDFSRENRIWIGQKFEGQPVGGPDYNPMIIAKPGRDFFGNSNADGITWINGVDVPFERYKSSNKYLLNSYLNNAFEYGIHHGPDLLLLAITILDAVPGDEFLGAARLGRVNFTKPIPRRYSPTFFEGRKVYRAADDFILGKPEYVDPKFVHPSIRKKIENGWTNLDLMKNGNSPIGTDGRPINLHHLLGNEPGPMVEILGTTHSKYSRPLHGLIEDGNSFRNIPGLENQYNAFRKRYWKWKADQLGGR